MWDDEGRRTSALTGRAVLRFERRRGRQETPIANDDATVGTTTGARHEHRRRLGEDDECLPTSQQQVEDVVVVVVCDGDSSRDFCSAQKW